MVQYIKMNRGLVIAVAVVILIVAGFFAFNQYIYNQKQGGQMQSEDSLKNTENEESSKLVTPISHASMVLNFGGQIVYNDPVGGAEAFEGQPEPDIILVSDIHGDHLNADTLTALSKGDTLVVVPQAVEDLLPDSLAGTVIVLKNGEKKAHEGVEIEAVPMYNYPEASDSRHTKGRGNGYILIAEGKRIYIAGDTAATPEMRSLTNIDVAFVPMNLPFTMGVEEAAEGVLAFKPKLVHPYHYRGQEGLADVKKFKQLVETGDPNIKVELLNFYPGQ